MITLSGVYFGDLGATVAAVFFIGSMIFMALGALADKEELFAILTGIWWLICIVSFIVICSFHYMPWLSTLTFDDYFLFTIQAIGMTIIVGVIIGFGCVIGAIIGKILS